MAYYYYKLILQINTNYILYTYNYYYYYYDYYFGLVPERIVQEYLTSDVLNCFEHLRIRDRAKELQLFGLDGDAPTRIALDS